MTSATDIPTPAGGVYGRRAPDPVRAAKALQFGKYDQQAKDPGLSFPPVDYLGSVDWSGTLNGNGSFGDCVACGTVNTVNLGTTTLTGAPAVATLEETVAFYKTQNPGFDPDGDPNVDGPGSPHDGGMDEQIACEDLVKSGITIGGKTYKAVGFVKVDHTNLQEMRNAISVGGSLLLGVNVASAQQSQFPGNWNYVADSPIEGGHCIIAGGHEDQTGNEQRAVTWAAEIGLTESFLTNQLEEAWLIIWPWHLGTKEFVEGMDVSTFEADVTAITGEAFPEGSDPDTTDPTPVVEVPPPAPEPPAPVTDPDADLARVAEDWVKGYHVGPNRVMQRALEDWLESRGQQIRRAVYSE